MCAGLGGFLGERHPLTKTQTGELPQDRKTPHLRGVRGLAERANLRILQKWPVLGSVVRANLRILQKWPVLGSVVRANLRFLQKWPVLGAVVRANLRFLQKWPVLGLSGACKPANFCRNGRSCLPRMTFHDV